MRGGFPYFRRGIVYLLLLYAAFVAGCTDRPELAPLGADQTVLAFGDSLTHGVGAPADQSYPALLEQLIGRKVISSGVPGEITENGLRRLPAVLDEHRPQLLILCHGGNDLLRRLDPATTHSNLQRMVELAEARGVQVVLVAVPKPGLGFSPPPYYQDIAAQYQLPYVDVLGQVLADNSLKSDLVHPNGAGYRHLAEAIAATLKESGAI